MQNPRTAALGDVVLQYECRGHGEPVVLVHAGVFADWFAPLLEEPALADRYQLISYHRVNYGGSSHLTDPVSVADQAAHCRALMGRLGIERAHVVGHSAGASIALQLALDAPEVVHSLAALDSARSRAASGPTEPPVFIAEALRRYGAGDKAGAIDTFMSGVCGPSYRAEIEAILPPGAFEQAVADADGLFGQELPALWEWSFAPEDARRVERPVLVVVGADSGPIFEAWQQTLLAWLPRAEAFTLPGATHLLHVQQPQAMAQALAAFFRRHPLAPDA